MLQAKWKGYNGNQEEGFTGYQATDSVFCYIEIFDAQIPQEEGRKILDSIVSSLETLRPGSLASFEEAVNSSLKKDSLPVDFSLALGYRVESVLYLKTIGSGSVVLKRGNHFATIIQGTNVASGYPQEGDAFVFTTDYFLKQMKGEDHLKKILHSKIQMEELEERMKAFYDGVEEGGGLVMATFQQDTVREKPSYAVPIQEQAAPVPVRRGRNFKMPDWKDFSRRWDRKKLIGAAVIAIIFIALVLNVGRLFGNKQKVVQESKFEAIRSQIATAATSWTEDSGDMQQALGQIDQFRQNLRDIKKNDTKVSAADLAAAEKELEAYAAKVLKRETKKAEVFTDLAMEEAGAQGSSMSLDGDTVAILNRQGRIYRLSLENKSLKKKVFPESANASLIGSYDGSVYFFKQGAGIYKIDTDDKIKRIVANDSEWGEVADMKVYNGNIYLLDPGKENIFKYLVAQDGYSDIIPYFKSGVPSLSKAKSFSIDVAIYIGLNDSMLKYLSGEQQDFSAQLPESDIALSKVYTSKDTEDVYAVDKAKGILYAWSKDGGTYVKQIQSDAFVKCDDLVIYKDSAYILKGPVVFKVGL